MARLELTTYHRFAVNLHFPPTVHHVQSKSSNAAGVRLARFWQSANGHVLVPHCLHLLAYTRLTSQQQKTPKMTVIAVPSPFIWC
jgi:hypothetical protein